MSNGSHLHTTDARPEVDAVQGLRSAEAQVLAERTGIEFGVDYVSERTGGQIIADSVRLYRKNFRGIFLVHALPILPLILIGASATANQDQDLLMGTEILKLVVAIFTLGAVSIAVSDVCLGNRPSIKRSYAAIGEVFWSYVGTYFLCLLATLVGYVLLILPGVYATVVLLFSLPVCIIERRSPIDACRRSIALGRGHYLRNFGVVFLASLLAILGMMIIAGLSWLSSGAVGLGLVTIHLITGLLVATVPPLIQIPVILLYYDMRARKENFDGAALAQELMT